MSRNSIASEEFSGGVFSVYEIKSEDETEYSSPIHLFTDAGAPIMPYPTVPTVPAAATQRHTRGARMSTIPVVPPTPVEPTVPAVVPNEIEVVKRKRGRPRKEDTTRDPISPTPSEPKRPRGRPRKDVKNKGKAPKMPSEPKRLRGRPRKTSVEASTSSAPEVSLATRVLRLEESLEAAMEQIKKQEMEYNLLERRSFTLFSKLYAKVGKDQR